MRKLIQTDPQKCVGCNRCVRECPLELANLFYRDGAGDIKVQVDDSRCIACGVCISVCAHNARSYVDDTQAFFSDLAAGQPISLIAAPSFKTNFPHWRRLLAWLRGLGVTFIYDVSLGADICIWAHLRYIEAEAPGPLITQPCPAIVSYCQTYRPKLLDNLSPIHSPMGCTAVYMRRYKGLTGPIAALSPCVAKANEFEQIGDIQYNITFEKLVAYIEEHHIELPEAESGFDHDETGLGSLFPAPGGFRENIEHFLGGNLRIDKSEGYRTVYRHLDLYTRTPASQLPDIFDVLSCADGCNMGPGCAGSHNMFELQSTMNHTRRAILPDWESGRREALHMAFDDALSYADFLRSYTATETHLPEVSPETVERAFLLLDKDTFAKRNFNCGACGSETCENMAKKIALGINIPDNCVIKSRDDAKAEHLKNARLYRRNAEYIALIHHIGENLLAVDSAGHTAALVGALRSICTAFDMGITSLWQAIPDGKGYRCARTYSWPTLQENPIYSIRGEWPEDWIDRLSRGEYVAAGRNELGGLFADPVERVYCIPVIIRGDFWGFLALGGSLAWQIAEEEISVITACGILIVSSIIEHEMTDALILAREDALAGTRAKSDFLSRMSHEMRTPMNAIIGMTKIARQTGDPLRLDHCLAAIDASSAHLLRLINDVLDMSKIEAGKLELDHAPFDLEQLLIGVCRIIGERADEKNQQLYISLENGLPLGYIGDELHLSQVVTNLLSNAVKFTPEGGRIAVDVSQGDSADGIDTLRIRIADSGIGLTPEQQSKLFTAFEQTDNSITRRFGGTGLGLAIARSIVEKMDGRIWVDSHPGEGSIFTFEVKLERATQQARRTPLPRSLRVAIIDDLPEYWAHASDLLVGLGLDPLVISSTEAVANSAVLSGCDTLFISHRLAGTTGVQLTALLPVPPEKIILVTSLQEWNRDADAASRAGLNRFVLRPLFPSQVADAILQDDAGGSGDGSGIDALPSLHGIRLLLAEDIEINREVFIALLEETGVVIDVAVNGLEALNMFEGDPDRYDIIIMDVQMPVMNGHEATRAIRALPLEQAGHIPILAMTANAFREDIELCLQSGMNDHLTKPIDEEVLVRKIAHYCGLDTGANL